jgi:hypothetical protein
MDTTRRRVIKGLVAYPAAALAVGTATTSVANLAAHILDDEPTIAAIEAHRAAIAALDTHASRQDALDVIAEDKREAKRASRRHSHDDCWRHSAASSLRRRLIDVT